MSTSDKPLDTLPLFSNAPLTIGDVLLSRSKPVGVDLSLIHKSPLLLEPFYSTATSSCPPLIGIWRARGARYSQLLPVSPRRCADHTRA